MTRCEWVRRYVAAMNAGGTRFGHRHLIDRAEAGCTASEEVGDSSADDWEDPETVAEEDLAAERNSAVPGPAAGL